MGGAMIVLDWDVRRTPVVTTLSCRSTSLTVAVGTSESVARTVVWRQAKQPAAAATARRNAGTLERLLHLKVLYSASVGSFRANCSPGCNPFAINASSPLRRNTLTLVSSNLEPRRT